MGVTQVGFYSTELLWMDDCMKCGDFTCISVSVEALRRGCKLSIVEPERI